MQVIFTKLSILILSSITLLFYRLRKQNDLPGEIQNANSIAAFKYNLKRLSNVSSSPLYYSSGNRTCQIYHTRIRANSSSLNQHLLSKHIVLDPHCVCGEVEDSRHFLIEWNLYQNIRDDKLAAVSGYVYLH